MSSCVAAALFGGLVIVAAPGRARADAIDGHCFTEGGLRITIQGSRFVSPGGRQMKSNTNPLRH